MGDAPDKRTVIDALVLACASSPLENIVGTDALRSVLDVEYRELTTGGRFDLQQVWELLEEQPGFDPDAAKPPMIRFKSWERHLGLEVVLPDALADMTESERAEAASRCQIATAEIKRLFRSELAQAADEARARKHSRKQEAVPSEDAATARSGEPRWRHPGIGVLAAVVALGCFAFAGFTLYESCDTSPEYESVSSRFAGELPVRDAKRMGNQVGATLSDEAWLRLDDETRATQMRAALEKLGDEVVVFYVRDRSDKVRATAQRRADGKIQLTFR